MSTVSDIYSLLQYRPDLQVGSDDLIHAANAAIRSISRRLYLLGSDLITAQMSVSVFAEVSYTASMAFVDSSPDTITDGASQFVAEGFEADMPITTDHASNAGPFRIDTVAVGTLTLASADSVTAATASSFTITSDDAYGFLPSDFWGLKERFEPYISGLTTPLCPLPSQSVALQYAGTGQPQYYKIQGSRLYVTPHTDTDITIIADYYQKPTAVTGETSTIPFNEMFDELIAEYVEMYFRGPMAKGGNQLAVLDKLIMDGVDVIVTKYDRKGPVVCPMQVNWEY